MTTSDFYHWKIQQRLTGVLRGNITITWRYGLRILGNYFQNAR